MSGKKQKKDIQYINIGWLLEETNTFNNLEYTIFYEGKLDLNVRTVNVIRVLEIIHQTFKPSIVSRHTRTFARLVLPSGSESRKIRTNDRRPTSGKMCVRQEDYEI